LQCFLYPDADPKNWFSILLPQNYENITIATVFLSTSFSLGAAFPINLFTSRMLPKVPRAMTASLPRLRTGKG
jgi:hypothetical protein